MKDVRPWAQTLTWPKVLIFLSSWMVIFFLSCTGGNRFPTADGSKKAATPKGPQSSFEHKNLIVP